jgi:7-carboxy-7-deazaguanine synthase
MIESLNISEMFLSVQGEGRHSGLPCFFIRTAGCDIRCDYCDTAYAYGRGESMRINEILGAVPQWPPLVQITGGEPLMQEEGLLRLIEGLIAPPHSKRILLETGGHRSLERIPKAVHIVMDIKLPGSGESDHDFVSNLRHLKGTDEIKFVVADRGDLETAGRWIRDFRLDGLCEILISPVFDALILKDAAEWICENRVNARLQTQLHKIIWGKEATGV